MHKKFEISRTKIKDGCQLGTKEVTYNSKSDLPLVHYIHTVVLKSIHFSESSICTMCFKFQNKHDFDSCQGSFINYVDQNLRFFDHLPTSG